MLQDAAAIFRWFSGKKPTREVGRLGADYGKEIAPFYRFASALWPVVFGNGIYGLSAAMKNWAEQGSLYSPLVANISLRHPIWGVYKR